MASKQEFEKKVAAVDALRSAIASEETTSQIRSALADRNNFLVSKAATIAGEQGLVTLTESLLTAFHRFLKDAVKTDPQCWAKLAIAKALRQLGHSDADVFLKGITHIQNEPVWGGTTDTAAALRGTCALALVESTLQAQTVLTHLVDLTADKEKIVRLEAVRAITSMGRDESELLLRLKLLSGDVETEVTGQCMLGLLELNTADAVSFVEKYLATDDDLRFEAIAALGTATQPEAAEGLIRCWRATHETAALRSLGLSKHSRAIDFLIEVAETGPSSGASVAIESLAGSRFRGEIAERLLQALDGRGDRDLLKVFHRFFKSD